MVTDPKTLSEPGTPEDLGLTDERPADADRAAERIEEKGEPFDGNFA